MDDYYSQRFGNRRFQSSDQIHIRKDGIEHIDLDGYAGFSDQSLNQNREAGGNRGESRPNSNISSALANQSNPDVNMNHGGGMMQFTGNSGNPGQQVSEQSLPDFQFDASSNSQQMLMPAGSIFSGNNNGAQQSIFGNTSGDGLHMGASTVHTGDYSNTVGSNVSYAPQLDQNTQMNMQLPSRFMGHNMSMGLEFSGQSFQNFQDLVGGGTSDIDMLQQANQYHSPALVSPANQNFPSQSSPPRADQTPPKPDRRQSMPGPQTSATRFESSRSNNQLQRSQTNPRRQSTSNQDQLHNSQENGMHTNNQRQGTQAHDTLQDNQRRRPVSEFGPKNPYQNAYSATGFDMLMVLMKVATRKNPEINIGAVDLSCAFVVCDASEHDFPIVYCSENFERLTGYTKYEILHRNCRFLQAPDGKVQAGVKRSYVDDDTVLYLKNMISARREAQVSLINYRKGGQPFMNLLTMIPVAYDSDEIKFFVGFQVDLVEQPNSVTNKNPDGSYTINYQRGLTMPRYMFNPIDKQPPQLESGQVVPRDDVSTVLSTIGSGESDLSRRIWDKVLLENTDDVVFVLSLKGLFLYLSPSSTKVLEYDANELTGTALSSVCHPSDIVPVTRELKETSTSSYVNVVFRIRRKTNGYMWFEGHGSLHTEQGKGRKSIVLVGRERPVYTLSKTEIFAAGGIGDNEIWSKLSTSGMFLFVASNIRQLLDKLPEGLVGTSIQALMRQETRSDFLQVLEVAKTGKRASTKHELLNKRGQVLQAYSTIYPGDAREGQKPTFLIAQTRLLKYSRPSGSQSRPQTLTKLERDSHGSVATISSHKSGTLQRLDTSPANNSGSQLMSSPEELMSTFESAMTYPGQQGLLIGHQDAALASEANMFDELKTTRSTSWQFELRQMEKRNRLLAEELQGLLAARKKRKRRKGNGQMEKDCANCHTRVTPEWRRGPSGNRDLCNSCGLRWAKQQGRISPRTSSQRSGPSASSDKASPSQHSQVHRSPSSQRASTGIPSGDSGHEKASNHNVPTFQRQSSSQGDETTPNGQQMEETPPTPMRVSSDMHSGGPGLGTGLPIKIDESAEENEAS